jgi:hypothetical protein
MISKESENKERFIVSLDEQHSNAIRWTPLICKWCFESLTIFFWVQYLQSRQSIFLPFFTPCVPIKLSSLHSHSHIHEPLAPPPPPRTSTAGLLIALVQASSSLPAGGELPCEGSSTWAVWLPRGELPCWICRSSSLPWRWQWCCDTVRTWRGGN